MREANWVEVIPATSRGVLWGMVREWRRGVIGEGPTGARQKTPKGMCRETYLPVGACFAQSSPSFHRCSRNSTTSRSIIAECNETCSHRILAKPMPSVQADLFSWVGRSYRYTQREVSARQGHQMPKMIPIGPTLPHSYPGRVCMV